MIERRKPSYTEEDAERIAVRAARKALDGAYDDALDKVYITVGKKMMGAVFTVIGVGVAALGYWLHKHGWL